MSANSGAKPDGRFLVELDCAQRTTRLLEKFVFDEDGKPHPATKPFSKEWTPIRPNTNVAWVSEVLCRK